jgi:hypothetical protein
MTRKKACFQHRRHFVYDVGKALFFQRASVEVLGWMTGLAGGRATECGARLSQLPPADHVSKSVWFSLHARRDAPSAALRELRLRPQEPPG